MQYGEDDGGLDVEMTGSLRKKNLKKYLGARLTDASESLELKLVLD